MPPWVPSMSSTGAFTMAVPHVIPPEMHSGQNHGGTLSGHIDQDHGSASSWFYCGWMWECEWDCLVDTEVAIPPFLGSFDLVPPLEPCEAFFGGWTGAVALHAIAREGDEIRYVDVTSFYPLGQLRTASTPFDIRISSPNRSNNPLGPTLASQPSTFFHPLVCWFVWSTSNGSLCRLRQHLVEIKTAICQAAQLVPDLGTE